MKQLIANEGASNVSSGASSNNGQQIYSSAVDYAQGPSHSNLLDIKGEKKEMIQEKILQALMDNTSQYTQDDAASQELQIKIRQQIEKKYANLIRNAHLYLSYMYLITYNFVKCIYHGKILLRLAEEAK